MEKKDVVEIKSIRKKFNPIQQQLIDSHVTLCREEEIENLDTSTLAIKFGSVTNLENDKGVLLPASGNNEQFHQLHEKVLITPSKQIRRHEPHITLMYPGN